MYELKTDAFFDSAHFLADYMGRCENIHGHRWRVEAAICAESLKTEGTERDMVCDFATFKHAARSIASELDHMFLVEEGTLSKKTIKCLEEDGFSLKILPFRTTAENFAAYFYKRLCARGFDVSYVEVDETPNNRAVFAPSVEERESIKAAIQNELAKNKPAPEEASEDVDEFFNQTQNGQPIPAGVNAATSIEANGLFHIKGRKRQKRSKNKSAQDSTFYVEADSNDSKRS
jgi:6-pyruvoyltetrahydropterin/6-carboxytetrahydropterin synthase